MERNEIAEPSKPHIAQVGAAHSELFGTIGKTIDDRSLQMKLTIA